MPRKTRKANGRKRPKKDGRGRKRDNNATRIFTKSFALCKRFCSVKSGRRRWGRCVRNRQIERRRRAEKSHDRLLVRNGVQIETPARQISHRPRKKQEKREHEKTDASSSSAFPLSNTKGSHEFPFICLCVRTSARPASSVCLLRLHSGRISMRIRIE